MTVRLLSTVEAAGASRLQGRLAAKVALLTLAAASSLAVSGPAAAQGQPPGHVGDGTIVSVRGDGASVTLSRRSVNEGRITFAVDTSNISNGSSILFFRLAGHANLARIRADLSEEFCRQSPAAAAQGTLDLTRDARFFGLAAVVGTSAEVTAQLTGGTYYLTDIGSGPCGEGPAFTTFTVSDSDGNGDNSSNSPNSLSEDAQGNWADGPVVKMTSADRFLSPGTLPAHGTVTVRNVANTVQMMAMQPVRKGTTDAEIQTFFDSGSQQPPPFLLNGPTVALEALSPGRQAGLTYKLHPGTYVLLCFVADDHTGLPRYVMGMHRVVILK